MRRLTESDLVRVDEIITKGFEEIDKVVDDLSMKMIDKIVELHNEICEDKTQECINGFKMMATRLILVRGTE
jgi:hypothetical protein